MVFRGTADQVALGEWMFQRLDALSHAQATAQQRQSPAKYEYPAATHGETTVRIVCLSPTTTEQNMNELYAAVHTVVDVSADY
jgi:N-acetyl-gamma-glutamylphosphate reductase